MRFDTTINQPPLENPIQIPTSPIIAEPPLYPSNPPPDGDIEKGGVPHPIQKR
jgi:hypothetical protein